MGDATTARRLNSSYLNKKEIAHLEEPTRRLPEAPISMAKDILQKFRVVVYAQGLEMYHRRDTGTASLFYTRED
jgi:hypothetical protein